MRDIKAIGEFKSIFIETKDIYLLIMKASVELLMMSREASSMHILPNGLHNGNETHVGNVVGEHHFKVFADAKQRNGIGFGHDVMQCFNIIAVC